MIFPRSTHAGVVVVGLLSFAVLAAGLLIGSRWPVSRRPSAPVSMTRDFSILVPSTPAPTTIGAIPEGDGPPQGDDTANQRIDRFLELLALRDTSVQEQDELERIQTDLASLGETGASALVFRLDHGNYDAARRDRMLSLLGAIPGGAAEDRLVREARSSGATSSRAIAIDSLAARRTDGAVQALGEIARTDPELPKRPLITAPRDLHDPSTELPDEVIFTPRMQAMAALSSTGDPRAAAILTDVLRDGPDESLRMEAARNLATLRGEPGTLEALRATAAGDASPYVRLAALHACVGSSDPLLVPVLTGLIAHDADAGVRTLAREILASLSR